MGTRPDHKEAGASAVEYSLLVAAIAAILVLVIFAIGSYTGAMFTSTCASMQRGDFPTTASCP
jgi:pilus assembly protein Flp/PilA